MQKQAINIKPEKKKKKTRSWLNSQTAVLGETRFSFLIKFNMLSKSVRYKSFRHFEKLFAFGPINEKDDKLTVLEAFYIKTGKRVKKHL